MSVRPALLRARKDVGPPRQAQRPSPPCADAFLSVLEPDGGSFAYSTFLGGDQDDIANGVALDGANNVYLVGETYSTDYPTTSGAYDPSLNGTLRDAFIAKVGALDAPPQPAYSHFDVSLAAGSDDAEEKASGSVSLTSSDLELVYDGSNQTVGIRFTGIDIPPGATIQDARIQFTVDAATSDTTALTIQAQAGDNPPTFASTSGNISSRPRTTASVSWSPAAWSTANESGPDQRTPDLSAVLQEIVDRPGWTEGNAVAFIITGTGKRTAKSYEEDVYGAPYLHVEYSLPEPATPTPTATETPTPTATPTPTLTLMPTLTLTPPITPTPIPTGPLTIDYAYDALRRLTGAAYSDGRSFGYTYDPAGNVLELQQNLGPGTVVTTYTYNTANELETAQQGSTTTQYTYDANGSLVSDGVKTYTYDSANRLVEVSDQSSVTSLAYNGLGQRLSMDAAGVIAHYVLDGDQPLTAESDGNTTYYLYGLGAIGEKTTDWAYSLPDGVNTPRQLADPTGDITLSARYTPWGDTLDIYGAGNFSFGYLGGILDATTDLIYVGNGQYYDPATGRFLTRDAKSGNSNPYVPWDPTGALLGPLGLLALVYGRKKKGSKVGMFLALLLVGLSVGMTLAACTPPPAGSTVQATVIPIASNQSQVTLSVNGTPTAVVEVPASPSTITVALCEEAPTPSPTPTTSPVPDYGVDLSRLSHEKSGRLKISGYDVFDAYTKLLGLKYKDQKPWYLASGSFTIWDYISLILMKDGGGGYIVSVWYFPQYTEAIGRSFYNWCNAYRNDCSDGSDAASVLNYLSHYSESAKGVVDNPAESTLPVDWNLTAMKPAIDALQDNAFSNGCFGNRPCHWGDLRLWADDPEKQQAAMSKPWFLVFIDRKFFITSLCQQFYWDGGYWQQGQKKEYMKKYPLCPEPGTNP